jgi:hypothetical protein
VPYEIPSSASGDSGLEGFGVETSAGPLGRVIAVNPTEASLVLLVDTDGAVRAVPLAAVERVELRPRRILLAGGSEWPSVEARVVRVESPLLVRHVPRELDPVTVEGTASAGLRASPAWIARRSALRDRRSDALRRDLPRDRRRRWRCVLALGSSSPASRLSPAPRCSGADSRPAPAAVSPRVTAPHSPAASCSVSAHRSGGARKPGVDFDPARSSFPTMDPRAREEIR